MASCDSKIDGQHAYRQHALTDNETGGTSHCTFDTFRTLIGRAEQSFTLTNHLEPCVSGRCASSSSDVPVAAV